MRKGKEVIENLTLIKPCDSLLDTKYGVITYLEWCELESKRVGNNRQVYILNNECFIK